MKTLAITLNPRAWLQTLVLALVNTADGIWQTLRSPRVWIGIASSLMLHSMVFFFSIERGNHKIPETPDVLIPVTIPDGGIEHPNVLKVLPPDPLAGPEVKDDIRNLPIKSTATAELQAMTQNTIDATDISAVEAHGIIRIPKGKQLTVEEILGMEPVTQIHATGGVKLTGIGPLVGEIKDLTPTANTTIKDPVIKPSVDPTVHATTVTQENHTRGSGFSLEGELSPADIVSAFMPEYPAYARAKGLTNIVIVLDFWVNSQGSVAPTIIVSRSTGFPDWDKKVQQTLARWKFTPAEATQRKGRITFRFVLE